VRVADGLPQRIRDKGQQHLPGDEAWLIGEHRMSGEKKYYLANLPARTDLRTLAATIKARWICEQAHQQLKEDLCPPLASIGRWLLRTTRAERMRVDCPLKLRGRVPPSARCRRPHNCQYGGGEDQADQPASNLKTAGDGRGTSATGSLNFLGAATKH
jgi:hypothetical protein